MPLNKDTKPNHVYVDIVYKPIRKSLIYGINSLTQGLPEFFSSYLNYNKSLFIGWCWLFAWNVGLQKSTYTRVYMGFQ